MAIQAMQQRTHKNTAMKMKMKPPTLTPIATPTTLKVVVIGFPISEKKRQLLSHNTVNYLGHPLDYTWVLIRDMAVGITCNFSNMQGHCKLRIASQARLLHSSSVGINWNFSFVAITKEYVLLWSYLAMTTPIT